jgi:hypothetical protein
MNTILQVIALIAAVTIFLRVEPVLNVMGNEVSIVFRTSFWLLAVGALALILVVLQGYVPSLPVSLIVWGIAIFLVRERRLRNIHRMRA